MYIAGRWWKSLHFGSCKEQSRAKSVGLVVPNILVKVWPKLSVARASRSITACVHCTVYSIRVGSAEQQTEYRAVALPCVMTSRLSGDTMGYATPSRASDLSRLGSAWLGSARMSISAHTLRLTNTNSNVTLKSSSFRNSRVAYTLESRLRTNNHRRLT